MTILPVDDETNTGRLVVAADVGDGLRIGMAVADVRADEPVATLRAVLVDDTVRGRGIGRSLVAALERHAAAQGVRRIETSFEADGEFGPAVCRMLDRAGWTGADEPVHMLWSTTARVAAAPWLRVRCPPGYEVVSWTTLTADDHAELAATQAAAPWYPPSLGPLRAGEVDVTTSVGVRCDGRIVAWMLTHRVAPDLVRYSRLFVAAAHRARLPGLVLVAEAIRRQTAADVPRGTLSVRPENDAMLRVIQRRLAPYADAHRVVCFAHKDLAQESFAG